MVKLISEISIIIFKLSSAHCIFFFFRFHFSLFLLVFFPVKGFPHMLSDPCLLAIIFCTCEEGPKNLTYRACQVLGFTMGDLVELFYWGSPSCHYLESLSFFLLRVPKGRIKVSILLHFFVSSRLPVFLEQRQVRELSLSFHYVDSVLTSPF